MNNIGKITKYTFKEQFFPYFPSKTIANYPKNYIGRIFLFLYSYVFFGVFFYFFQKVTGSIYLTQEGGSITYFTMFAVAVSLMILLFYVPRIISDFFADKNSRIYKTLPITEGELFIGKLFGGILSYLDFFVFLIVALVVYFIEMGFDFSILLFAVLNFINVVTIPYTILAGLILIIMKYTNAASHRKLLKNIGYLFLFLIIGFIYYNSIYVGGGSGDGSEAETINKAVEAVSSISGVFFNAKFFGLAVAGTILQRIIYTLILFAISALLIFLLYKFANLFYYESITEKDGVGESKKKTTKSKNTSLSQQSPVFAIGKRDFKNLFSNIVFLSMPIMMLIIFGIVTLKIGQDFTSTADFSMIPDGEWKFWIFLIGAILSMLVWVNSGFATNGLSREHTSFYLFQTLPIRPIDHYVARLLSSMTASSVFNLVFTIIIAFALKLNIIDALIAFIGLSVGALLANAAGAYLGTKKINTNWKKPEELSKGGVRYFIYYILSLVLGGAMIALYAVLISRASLGHNFASLILIGLILLLIFIFIKLGIRSYKKGFYDVD